MRLLHFLIATFFIISFSSVYGQWTTTGSNTTTTNNVGIGVTNPTSPLYISSTTDAIATFKTKDNQWLYTNWLNSSGQRKAYMGFSSDLTNFMIGLENGANKFSIPSGNVGIGTTNPEDKLHVKGSVIFDKGGSYSSIRLGSQSNDRVFADNLGAHYGGGMWFRVHDESVSYKYRDVMMLSENGNVGIGAVSSGEKLHVEGSLMLDSYSLGNNKAGIFFREGFNSSTNNYNLSILNYDHSNAGTSPDGLSINAYDGVSFSTGSNTRNERMRINKDGNVGIGTTDPKNKLSVNGTIWAKKVKITFSDAADWVFEDSYNLRPLSEVATFIKAHKHLPEIPSADEFRANDMELSQMTNKLLQKIEELTLYTIAQEEKLQQQNEKLEQVEALQIQNNELSARLAKLEALLVK